MTERNFPCSRSCGKVFGTHDELPITYDTLINMLVDSGSPTRSRANKLAREHDFYRCLKCGCDCSSKAQLRGHLKTKKHFVGSKKMKRKRLAYMKRHDQDLETMAKLNLALAFLIKLGR